MNLTIERAPALSALSRVVGIVEKRNTIPILGNVAIRADASGLQVRATDLDMEAVETIQAEVSEPGEITIPADKFHDIVRNSDAGAQLAMSLGSDDPRVKLKAGRSNFRVPVLSAASFPTFVKDDLSAPFTLSSKLLADMISRVIWAIDRGDKNSVKGCVLLAVHEDQLHAVGSNGKIVALRREPAPEGAKLRAIMPAKLAGQLVSWLGAVDEEVQVSAADWDGRSEEWTSQRMVRFTSGGAELTSKLQDAPAYFPYERFIREAHELSATTDQDALNAAVRRVLIASDESVRTVKMTFSAGAVTVSARGNGEGEEEISAGYDGPEVSVLLNGAQLQAAMGALKGDVVEFGFSPKDQIVVIKAPADGGMVCNVAQMRA